MRAALTCFLSQALIAAALVSAPRPASASDSPLSPILFIHGIKGSSLLDAKGRVHWLNGAHVFGLSTPSLSLPTGWGPVTQDRDQLTAGGVLEHVTIFPVLYKEKIYSPWIAALRKSKRPFHVFSYDWRRSNMETIGLLEGFVHTLREKHGYKNFVVVGHSMGGMLAMALFNRQPEAVRALVFAGTPFGGSIGFLPDQQQGEKIGFNKKLLTRDVMDSFPSAYSFLPLSGTRLKDAAGVLVPGDYYSSETWKRLRLGYYAASATPAQEAHLMRSLGEARRFRMLLQPRSGLPRVPVLAIASDAHPTLAFGVQKGESWDFVSAPRAPGDGRFLLEDVLPPAALGPRVLKTKMGHSDLLSDPDVTREILAL